MPLFVIIGSDVANSTAQRQIHRPAHLARLTALQEQNRLILAGPTPIHHSDTAMSGSIIIAEFDDIDSAKAWADADPYFIHGIYSHVEIRPFIKALP